MNKIQISRQIPICSGALQRGDPLVSSAEHLGFRRGNGCYHKDITPWCHALFNSTALDTFSPYLMSKLLKITLGTGERAPGYLSHMCEHLFMQLINRVADCFGIDTSTAFTRIYASIVLFSISSSI